MNNTFPRLRNLLILAALTVLLAGRPLLAAPAVNGIQFNRDIKPILTDNCFHCHGPDPGSRKAGLRLDQEAGFFAKRKEGPTIIKGKPLESPLYQRLITKDEDDVMPPPAAHKTLKPEQKELIRRWIEIGAPWQPHWSFIPPERPALPAVRNKSWVSNPIDTFILAKLEANHLKPAPEANRRTLIRRLTLDLTGLPPTPEETEAFVQDKRKDAYEQLVTRLMNSPRYGEHRARYWLDVARYADTHGLHFDNYREMWPYRDWVINAFNHNLPFDKFTLEQIAGDLLDNPTQDDLIATGFHRCNITTNEGGTIEDENLANYANDRVTTTAWVWLGLTANCAACHDHKFDPISQRDFYSMAAFFRNTTQRGLDGNVKDSTPSITVIDNPKDYARWQTLPKEIETAKLKVEENRKGADPAFTNWVGSLKPGALSELFNGADLSFRAPLNEGLTNQVTAMVAGTSKTFTPTGTLTVLTNGHAGPALKIGAGATVAFPEAGDFDQGQPFSYGAWVYVPNTFNDSAALLARMDDQNAFRGWDIWLQQGQFTTHIINNWPDNALKVHTSKRIAKKGRWQHVFVTYNGSGRPEGVRIYVDGEAEAVDVENGKGVTGSIRTKTPLKLAQRSSSAHLDELALQDVRIYSRELKPEEVKVLAELTTLDQALAKSVDQWKPKERDPLFNYFLATRHEPFQAAEHSLAALEREREGIRLKYPITHIQQEKKDTMPMAAILFRGQYDQPRDKVEAATFASLNPLPKGAPRNRLGLAEWLITPANPLTARVTVNRFWQELFGTGLVKTTEDFGIMGEPPVNQELLDWLAVEFEASGWDVKKLFTLMVTSSAYRQSAETTPAKLEKDPNNRLLSRGPRFRMDAEMIRDYALSTSGLLSDKVGGPSVKPYQPDGVWEAVAMPESNTRYYKRDQGEALYRRSMYTFWKRAAPPAAMDILNAPSREVSCPRRERTDTPLQALATMNDPQFVEASRHLAEVAWHERSGDAAKAVDVMAARVLLRPLSSKETSIVQATLKDTLAYYQGHAEDADKLIHVGASKPDAAVPAPQLAALTMVANQLLNLDEALNK